MFIQQKKPQFFLKKFSVLFVWILFPCVSFSLLFPHAVTQLGRILLANISPDNKKRIAQAVQWRESVKKHEIATESFAGLKLAATIYFQPTETNPWMIIAHGYMNSQATMLPQTKAFFEQGFNILAIDHRGHGKSKGAVSTMGESESKDIQAWVNKLIEKNPTAEIVLLGSSLGAVSCLRAAGKGLPRNVKCIVADSCYNSILEIVANTPHNISINSLRSFPIPFLGAEESETTAEQLKFATLPILFIHSKKDAITPLDQANTVFAAAPDGKELIITNAAHNHNFEANPKEYIKRVMRFINKHGITPTAPKPPPIIKKE